MAWDNVPLGELLTESKIKSNKPNSDKRIKVKLHMAGVEARPSIEDKSGATQYYIRQSGQFIYGKQNLHKGAFGIIPADLDGYESSSDIPAFNVNDRCSAEWIYYFFKQGDFYLRLEQLARGVGSKRIQPTQIYAIKIPLPPKSVQQKILNAIAENERHYESLKRELSLQKNLVRDLVTKYYQEAFTGLMTADWRLENEKLPKNAKQLSGQKTQNLKLVNSKPMGIPKAWNVKKIGAFTSCERGKFSARPRNDPKYFNGTIPFIQIGDLPANGGYINSHSQTLNTLGLTVSKLFQAETVVIAIVGSTIGNTGLLAYDMCFPDSLVGIRPANDINTGYIEMYLRSQRTYFRLASYSGGGQPNIKLPNIKDFEIPLPSLSEQAEIVTRLNKLLSLSDNLLASIVQQENELDSMTALQLRDAFQLNEDSYIKLAQLTEVSINDNDTIELETMINNIHNTSKLPLLEIVANNQGISPLNLWRLSEFANDINQFYEQIKLAIDDEKIIIESTDKTSLSISHEN
jgi:type I restriction enzyme S subunit